MYKLEVFPVAKEDMVEIVRYISKDLKKPQRQINFPMRYLLLWRR